MKRFICALICILAIAGTAYSAEVVFNVPRSNNGVYTPAVDFCGADSYTHVGSSIPVVITKVPTILYGVITTTGTSATAFYVITKDTAPAVLSELGTYGSTTMGAATWDALAEKTVRIANQTNAATYTFGAPIIFSNGLTVSIVSTVGVNEAIPALQGATFIYRKLIR